MTGLITAGELTKARARASAMLPNTCTIQTRSTVSDAMGGITETWSNTYTGVACKLSVEERASVYPADGQQFQVHTGWVLSVAFDQAIAAGNRAVVGGDTFEVVSVDDDHDYRILRRGHLRRAD